MTSTNTVAGPIERLSNEDSNYKAHLEAVRSLETKNFPEEEISDISLEVQLQPHRKASLFVAFRSEERKAVIGYVMVTWSSLAGSISKLAVDESYRQLGYGQALLQTAVSYLQDIKKLQCINLHVDPQRTVALQLYTKLGFALDATVPDYYSKGRIAHRMTLDLSQ
mmetsp:Transcript_34875/g.42060  ORF Transcript_34875/g.42060 Transcript_34875/m.42060 type:complete len:166 (-) Transcript_34875:952-1449(-)